MLRAIGMPLAEVGRVLRMDGPEQRVISIQGHVDAAGPAGFVTEASATLFGHLSAAGACLSGPPFTIYHGTVSEDSNGPVEVCLPTESPIEPAGRIGLRLEPAHREAYVMVAKEHCGYPAILPAYDALRAWLDDHDLPHCLSAREIYHPGWETGGPGDHVADVAFPFSTAAK